VTKIATLLAIALCFLSVSSRADYDPRDDPNSPQNIRAAKIAKERAAQQKIENAKRAREADLKMKRARLGKEKMAEQKIEADKAAAAANVQLKAILGKSTAELQAMPEKERKAFMDAHQKKQSDQMKASVGVSMEEMQKMSPAQRKEFMDKMMKERGIKP
jgi:inactivated superfamily I helicase